MNLWTIDFDEPRFNDEEHIDFSWGRATRVTEWPPEAIEAAKDRFLTIAPAFYRTEEDAWDAIHRLVEGSDKWVETILAATWETLTGDNK